MRPSIISGWRTKYSLICSCAVWGVDAEPAPSNFRRVLPHAARTLLKEQDVGRHVRAGVGLECGVRQPDAPRAVSLPPPGVPNSRILFVHCVATRDQRDQAARPDHIKGLREKVVVDGAGQVRTAPISRIENRVVAERDVSDRRVEEVFRKSNVSSRAFR